MNRPVAVSSPSAHGLPSPVRYARFVGFITNIASTPRARIKVTARDQRPSKSNTSNPFRDEKTQRHRALRSIDDPRDWEREHRIRPRHENMHVGEP
jgi:hypothetical protein